MTRVIQVNRKVVVVIEVEVSAECTACGKLAELRPYGVDGQRICFECANKDPLGTEQRMLARFSRPR